MKNWKKTMKQILCGFLAVLLAVVFVPTAEPQAAAPAPSCEKNHTVYLQKENGAMLLQHTSSYIHIKNLSSKAEVTDVKSSNKNLVAGLSKTVGGKQMNFKAIAVQKRFGNGEVGVVKNGDKTKITFTVKQNGKTYKLYSNVTFKYAQTPFRHLSLQYGTTKKDYASAFRGYSTRNINKPNASRIRVYVSTVPGYEVSEITALYQKADGVKFVTVKNGSWISTKDLYHMNFMYRIKKKPVNYSEPEEWGGTLPTPMHDYVSIHFK